MCDGRSCDLPRRSTLSEARRSIEALAEAVSDGEAIDWPWAKRLLADGADRRLAAGLEAVATATGSQPARATRPESARRGGFVASGPRVAVRALAALVAAQGLLVLVVAIAGPAASPSVPELPVLLLIAMLLAVGLGLVVRERRDGRALWLAGVLFAIAAGPSRIYLGRLAVEPSLPSALAHGLFPECFFAPFVWGFARDFPRRARFGRHAAAFRRGLEASTLLAGLLFVANLSAWAFDAARGSPLASAVAATIGAGEASWLWPLQAVAALAALPFVFARGPVDDELERRRVRWFVVALTVGLAPLLLAVLGDVAWPAFARAVATPVGLTWSAWAIYGALFAVPIASAYAVVARRLLDVRTVLHGATRLALARWTWAALTLLPMLLLVRGLLATPERTIAEAARDPGLRALVAAAFGGALLFFLSPRLLARLEERWLGRLSHLDALLARFGAEVLAARDATTLERATRALAADLFGAGRAALLLPAGASASFASATGAAPPLARDSAVAYVLAASREALVLDPEAPATLFPWLGESDRQWVLDGDLALALPLAADAGAGLAGVLALGRARTGVPYPSRAVEAARAVVSTVALALERTGATQTRLAGAGGAAAPAGQCRGCGTISSAASGRCQCGGEIELAALPLDLAGKFRLEALLGRGGMGIVYRARDIELDRSVALKTLPRVHSSALVRMRREARAMAAVAHPHLATLFGIESYRGTPILVVELLAGGSLERRLGAAWPADRALHLVADIASALAALHEHGYLHRDVKPSNIAFTARDEAKLLDFGLTLWLPETGAGEPAPGNGGPDPMVDARETASDLVVGTPLFLSPECLRGEAPTPQRDLWALGLVLWELLAGAHPWRGLAQRQALRRLARAELPPVATTLPGIPESVARFLARALAPRREDRFGDAREMAGAARSLARTLTGSDHPPDPLDGRARSVATREEKIR